MKIVAVFVVTFFASCFIMSAAFIGSQQTRHPNTAASALSAHSVSRREAVVFVWSTATAAAAGMPLMARAAETPDALKGTKKDPAYESCLSLCMYDCTKPKGVEQKSRAECLPECKVKCATTKEQLLKGTPIKKS